MRLRPVSSIQPGADRAAAAMAARGEAGGGRRGGASSRPKTVAVVAIVALAGLGWLYLGLMVAGMAGEGRAGGLGPGMAIFDFVAGVPADGFARALIEALCRPTLGRSSGVSALTDLGLPFLMWSAMVVAMMLPSAAPMVLTYAELAQTARQRGEAGVSPLVLIAGYGTVWLGFCIAATGLQFALVRAALIDASMATASPLFSGALFVAAGLYQFSALKHACVTRCQTPFPFFVANWSDDARRIYGLGVWQGLYCLGCCWAAMAVMFAVGVMNVVWMAGLGLIMTAEKVAATTRLSRAIGVFFLLIGMAFSAGSIAAHWPVRP